uniref:Uncharacterized protein n=1 Tax=Vibrio parahaemolyticus TaxID=670 RepID=A0A5P4S6M4_VIBPH|nr:hypothetical protein [Vibrio parahaemolyticus]
MIKEVMMIQFFTSTFLLIKLNEGWNKFISHTNVKYVLTAFTIIHNI